MIIFARSTKQKHAVENSPNKFGLILRNSNFYHTDKPDGKTEKSPKILKSSQINRQSKFFFIKSIEIVLKYL